MCSVIMIIEHDPSVCVYRHTAVQLWPLIYQTARAREHLFKESQHIRKDKRTCITRWRRRWAVVRAKSRIEAMTTTTTCAALAL